MALATQAATLGELQSLISDLQTANAPVQLPDLKRRPKMPAASGGGGWGIRIAIAGVLVRSASASAGACTATRRRR